VFEHGEWNVVNRFVTDEVRRSEELESREKYEEWLEEEWLEEGRRRRVRQLLIAAIVVVVIVVVLLASAVSGNGQGAVAAFSAGTSTANGWWT
jgi:hypothetical protein